MSSESFADLGVSRPVLGALAERGIKEPFAVQRLCIADVLAGEDVLVQSPTGSGKTFAFGIPMVERINAEARRPAALVLAPTRELAEQIVDELRAIAHSRALKVAAVFGGVGIHGQAKQAANAHIVVATPGRLEDQLERGAFDLKRISILVLDEADRMLDIGFKPAIDRIVAKMPRDRQTLFFSATLEGATGKLAAAYTRNPKRHVHKPEGEQGIDIEHRFVHLSHEAKVDALVRTPRHRARPHLVFVRTKRGADRLVKSSVTRRSGRWQCTEQVQSQRRRALAPTSSSASATPWSRQTSPPRDRRRGHHARDQASSAPRTATPTCTAPAARRERAPQAWPRASSSPTSTATCGKLRRTSACIASSTQAPDSSTPLASTPAMEAAAARASTATVAAVARATTPATEARGPTARVPSQRAGVPAFGLRAPLGWPPLSDSSWPGGRSRDQVPLPGESPRAVHHGAARS